MQGATHMVQRPLPLPSGKGFRPRASTYLYAAKQIMLKLKDAANQKKSVEAESLKEAVQAGDCVTAQKIIKSGADVNAMLDQDGHTALMLAVQRGDSKMVQVLTTSGASPMVQD